MVHYSQKHTTPAPPPTCPKCGSHRTEVVGIIDVPSAIVVRCSACGERSIVPLSENAAA